MVAFFHTLYNNIGIAGLVLIFFAFYGLYLALRNLIYISLVRRGFRKGYRNLLRYKHSDEGSIKKFSGSNPMLAIIWEVVHRHSEHSEDMRAEVGYLFYRNFETVSRGLYWIRLITVISPLLGLLGTVLGMVEVFQAIAAESNPDATVLASGIWEALLTTVLGLSIAIPMLMIYYFLLLRFKGFRIEAIEYSYRALSMIKNSSSLKHVEGV